MVSRPPRAATKPWTRISRAAAAVAAAAAVLATSAPPAGAFVAPPATFPSPSARQHDTPTTAATTTISRSSNPTAAVVDSPERGWMGARLRVTAGGGRRRERFSSGLGRPLRAASSGGDSSGVPESGEGGGEDGANGGGGDPAQPEMSESEKLREKLETIAKTTPAAGITQQEQEELDELEEDRRVEAEVDSLEAAEKEKVLDPFRMEDDEDVGDGADEEVYEEIIANMTKPLGITIEESTDKAQLVYLTSVGDKAEAAGLKVGDVLTGVSAVFGDAVWSVKEKNIEEIRSLVRCRTEPYSLIRVERGHVSLEERCAPGFDEEDLSNCWQLPDDMLPGEGEECELNPDYANLWAAVYEDEMEVLTGDSAARAAGVGRGGLFSSGAGGGGQPKTGNQGPPPKDKPGPGSFNGETFTGDSWDTSGASF